MRDYTSWGRYPEAVQTVLPVTWRHMQLPAGPTGQSLLPHGLGRSYGDSCLNDGNVLLSTSGLSRFIDFNSETGILRCESGVSLAAILAFAVPRGWFLPVTPGTKFVTVGGAIANDVHGKNHHVDGTFGNFVRAFELVRSDRGTLRCSPTENPDLFRATIGGLGLTGLITWAEIALHPIVSRFIDVTTKRTRGLAEFFHLSETLGASHKYLVSWVDCFAPLHQLGRGTFMCGDHSVRSGSGAPHGPEPRFSIPLNMPPALLNPWTLRAFNLLYYNKQSRKMSTAATDYEPFFYPLDAIAHWNRLYGSRGPLQWQCVVPPSAAAQVMPDILRRIRESGLGSFLAVMKTMGDKPSAGLMSFSRPGVTLALDFPVDPQVFRLLEALDQIVTECGGALYPAKDARMDASQFQHFFPQWERFQSFIDPRFSSSFWRRVTRQENN